MSGEALDVDAFFTQFLCTQPQGMQRPKPWKTASGTGPRAVQAQAPPKSPSLVPPPPPAVPDPPPALPPAEPLDVSANDEAHRVEAEESQPELAVGRPPAYEAEVEAARVRWAERIERMRVDYAVFDTETSGSSRGDVVIQLAFVLCSSDGRVQHAHSRLWRLPSGVRIGWPAYNVHKIGEARVRREGVAARGELADFFGLCLAMREAGKRLVAHNAAYDVRMLGLTAGRHELRDALPECADAVFCTYRSSCGKGPFFTKQGRRKGAKNAELYSYLHGGQSWPGGDLHDALEDVKCTSASYAAGRKRGWW
jgi:DNA polymerase III epsilon subunit-like protein